MVHRILTVLVAIVLLGGVAFAQGHPPQAAPQKPAATAPSQPGPSFKIEGDVKDGAGNGIFGANVTTAGSLSAKTDAKGHYVLKGVHRSGMYIVKVTKSDFTFDPDHKSVNSPTTGDVTGIDFSGTKKDVKK